MALMSLRSRSHVIVPLILTRADHLYIHNYMRSLLNIILRPIVLVRTSSGRGSNTRPTACVSDALPTEPHTCHICHIGL